MAGGDPYPDWIRRFVDQQPFELKPWIRCDGTGRYPYIEVSIKGARHNNEDTSFGDGNLFAVFDGHGGKFASQLLRNKMSDNFYASLGQCQSENDLIQGVPPRIVQALDDTYTRLQELMPTEFPSAQSGSTATVCCVHGTPGLQRVYASCLGDSKALLFDLETGGIPVGTSRVWDAEMGTLQSQGVEAVGRSETMCHNLTGSVILDVNGEPCGMEKDPYGVGFRELSLLRARYGFPASRRPFNVSNMPGEERWRILDVEPSRALGHKLKREPPLRHPEVFEWNVATPARTALMLSCDGFYSKDAFHSADSVTQFLADPAAYLSRPNLFDNTCLKALLERLGEAHKLPDPKTASMGALFDGIRNIVFNKLSDETWTSAYDSAYKFLSQFAAERPVPNIRTHPVMTLLAACYFAVLMVSDDNVSVTLVFLDGVPRFAAQRLDLGPLPV